MMMTPSVVVVVPQADAAITQVNRAKAAPSDLRAQRVLPLSQLKRHPCDVPVLHRTCLPLGLPFPRGLPFRFPVALAVAQALGFGLGLRPALGQCLLRRHQAVQAAQTLGIQWGYA